MDFYSLVVIAQVLFATAALGGLGTSASAMFQARREPDRARLAADLDLSQAPLGLAGIALIVALQLGIIAAILGGQFGRFWPWAAIGAGIVVFGVMTPMGANPMGELRRALGMSGRGDRPGDHAGTSPTPTPTPTCRRPSWTPTGAARDDWRAGRRAPGVADGYQAMVTLAA